jgi:hypothetical protein
VTTSDVTADRIAGRWAITATVDGEPASWNSVIDFRANHTLAVSGPEAPGGEPSFTGSGYWVGRPDGSFMYYLSHSVPNGNGGSAGTIHSLQRGTIDGATHATSGGAILQRPDGAIEAPHEVELRGTR